MGFSDEKRAFFVEALGEERVATLEDKLPALSKELEKEGVNFKDLVDDLLPAPAPAKVEASATKDADAGNSEKPPEGEGSEAPAGDPDLTQRVSAIESQLEGIGANLKELVDSNKTLTESIPKLVTQRMDEALTGRKSAPNGDGQRPTESKENTLSEEEAAKVTGTLETGASKAASPYIDDLVGSGAVKN